MASTLNLIPETLTAGESLSVSVSVSDYKPSDGWALVYKFVYGVSSITANGNEDAEIDGWTVELTPAETLSIPSGTISFHAFAQKSSESVIIESHCVDAGTIQVKSLVSKWSAVLESVEAAIASWGTSDQRSMSIEGMSVSYRSIEELLHLRAFCTQQIKKELGRKGPHLLRTRFNLA